MALTIRLTQSDEWLIEKLKEITGESSASKALLKAANDRVYQFPKLQKQAEDNERDKRKTIVRYRMLVDAVAKKSEAEKEIADAINSLT